MSELQAAIQGALIVIIGLAVKLAHKAFKRIEGWFDQLGVDTRPPPIAGGKRQRARRGRTAPAGVPIFPPPTPPPKGTKDEGP